LTSFCPDGGLIPDGPLRFPHNARVLFSFFFIHPVFSQGMSRRAYLNPFYVFLSKGWVGVCCAYVFFSFGWFGVQPPPQAPTPRLHKDLTSIRRKPPPLWFCPAYLKQTLILVFGFLCPLPFTCHPFLPRFSPPHPPPLRSIFLFFPLSTLYRAPPPPPIVKAMRVNLLRGRSPGSIPPF